MRPSRTAVAAAAVLLLVAGAYLGWSSGATAARAPEGGPTAPAAPPHDLTARIAADEHKYRVAQGKLAYDRFCAHCHGVAGKGDGPSGQSLPIKPQDLTQGLVMNPLPDHFLARIIAEGGQSVGLSPLMPAFKPQLSDVQIADVITYVRTLARPAFDGKELLPVARERRGPVQPIFFSHVIHAGSFRIDCQYCHVNARRGPAAGLPSVERCMGCHKIIAAEGNPEVKKLHAYWERKEPIPWVRVFKVPEHARFVHKGHVDAGVPCQTCHGRIEAMEQVWADTGQSIANDLMNLLGIPAAPPPLTMGWCIECHRAANSKALASLSWIPRPVPTLKKEHPNAPLECVTCHH